MKKHSLIRSMAAVLLAMVLLMGTAAAEQPEGAYVLYESSFKQGLDGWYTLGGEELYINGKKSLGIRKRTEDWNGPRRDFTVEAGTAYYITAEVFQKDTESASFILSRAYTDEGGKTTYENLTWFEVPKKKWTAVSRNWTPGFSGLCTLYVETSGAPELGYEIRNFSVSKAPNEAESFLLAYQKDYAKSIDKTIAELKKLPIPEFMTASGREPAAWVPEKEIPETAALLNTETDDGKITVTLDRKVTNAVWRETDGRGYYVKEQEDRSCDVTAFTPDNPMHRVILDVMENLKEGKTSFTCHRSYEFNQDSGGMELLSTEDMYNLAAAEYPPYDKVKRTEAWVSIFRRGDGTLSGLDYTFTGGGVANSLDVKAYADESGNAERFVFTRGGDAGNLHFNARMTTDGEFRPVSMTWYTWGPGKYLSFTVEQPDPSDPNTYYLPTILEKYTQAQLDEPGAVMWAYTLDFGSGCMIHYYLTKDDMFAVDENGAVRLSETARDMNGEPFPALGVSPLIEPELYTLP